jgi:hypothetical protein
MSISTASETINTNLTDLTGSSFFTTNPKEVLQCVTFNFKIIFAFSLTILILSLFISCINVIFPPMEDPNDIITYEPRMLKRGGGLKYVMCNCVDGKCNCKSNNIEHFSNDEMYSFKSAPRSTYQSIPLLAPSEDNLFFGQAKRFVSLQDEKVVYRLEVYCNLFVLDGNIYDKAERNTTKQKYSVFLRNSKTRGSMKIGDLVKDGDGIYKLKFISDKNINDLVNYDQINIVYSLNDNEQILLSGKFH